MKILVIDDDPRVCRLLRRALVAMGYVVDTEPNGAAGECLAREDGYDAIVLDLRLPDKEGLGVLRDLRGAGVATPVLVLTARVAAAAVVALLDAGGDDYLRKPFDLHELEARLRAITRRPPDAGRRDKAVVQVDGLAFDGATHRATFRGREIAMTARELALFAHLMRHAGRIVPQAAVERVLRGSAPAAGEPRSNLVEAAIWRLRQKLAAAGCAPTVLQTVRGVGYRFVADPVEDAPHGDRNRTL